MTDRLGHLDAHVGHGNPIQSCLPAIFSSWLDLSLAWSRKDLSICCYLHARRKEERNQKKAKPRDTIMVTYKITLSSHYTGHEARDSCLLSVDRLLLFSIVACFVAHVHGRVRNCLHNVVLIRIDTGTGFLYRVSIKLVRLIKFRLNPYTIAWCMSALSQHILFYSLIRFPELCNAD